MFLASAILAGILATGCADVSDDNRLAEAEVRDSMPTQEFENVEMAQTHDGDLQFILKAPRLDRYDKLDRAIFYGGIRIQFFEKGEESSVLTSDRGEVHAGGDELIALGNVVVTTDTGTTILTPRIKWSRKSGLITSDTVVTIITDYDTLYGTGLIATENLKQRRILQPTGVTHRTVGIEDTTTVIAVEDSSGVNSLFSPETSGTSDSLRFVPPKGENGDALGADRPRGKT
ncbi:MAG: LPS export ABC transporter periplasmic protein LptC [bacterium]